MATRGARHDSLKRVTSDVVKKSVFLLSKDSLGLGEACTLVSPVRPLQAHLLRFLLAWFLPLLLTWLSALPAPPLAQFALAISEASM